MKPVLFLFCFLFSVLVSAQEAKDVFEKSTKVTWLGLDFTKAKFIGDRERYGSTSDVQRLLEAWNDLMEKEKDKYNVAAAIDKDKEKVELALDITKEHNQNIDPTELLSNDESDFTHLRENDIASIVADYDFKDNGGVGVMFIVDSFSKPKGKSSVWVTFINLNSKEVLFTERVEGAPGGAGLRNYWGNSIGDILTKMRKKEFEMWRKKHYRKF